MSVERNPKNLDFSKLEVQQQEAGWSLRGTLNQVEIYNWKDKRQARRALADEYMKDKKTGEAIEPGTTQFEARKLHAEYRKQYTQEDFIYLHNRERSKRTWILGHTPEEQELSQEISQRRNEDTEFDKAYDESEKKLVI